MESFPLPPSSTLHNQQVVIVLSEGSGADGILDQVLVDLDATVFEVNAEQSPKVQRVVQGQAHAAAGQVAPPHFETSQRAVKSLVNRSGLMSADGSSKLRPTPVVSKFSFDTIKVADLAQDPMGDERVLVTPLVKLPSCMRLMWSST